MIDTTRFLSKNLIKGKKAFVASLALVFVLGISACDGSSNSKDPNKPDTPDNSTTNYKNDLNLDLSKTIFVKEDGVATNDGSSWSKGVTLQKALELSSKDDKNTIVVAQGTYKADDQNVDESFNLKSGVKIYGGFVATSGKDIDKSTRDLTKSILEGDLGQSKKTKVILKGTKLNSDTLLDGFTIQNAENSIIEGYGGAFQLTNSDKVTLSNLTFKNNKIISTYAGKSVFGGAIGIEGAEPKIVNCTFENNSAVSKPNGAGTVTSLSAGGAIYARKFSEPGMTHKVEFEIINSKFVSNSADEGGAIGFEDTTAASYIKNSIFVSNTAKQKNGGAIYSNSDFNITNSNFVNNSVLDGKQGGAIYHYYGTLTLYNSILWNNKAGNSLNNIYGETTVIPKFNLINKNSYGKAGIITTLFNKSSLSNKTLDATAFNIKDDGTISEQTSIDIVKNSGNNDNYKAITKIEAKDDKDFAGDSRLKGETIDIGAYEF